MSNNLTFKLILDGDNKGLVSATKQSQEVTTKVFETIRNEADKLKQTSAETTKVLGNIVPEKSKALADGLTKSLSAATQIIRDAGDDAKSTANNFTDFGNKSVKALAILKTDLDTAKKKLEAFAKTKASPADIEIAQKQVDQLEKEVQQAEGAFNEFHAEVGKANTNLKNTSTSAETAQRGLNGAKFAVNALVGAMAALGVGLGIRELAQAADSYTNLSARINIATKDGGNFTSAMAGIHQVALSTNSSLEATGSLFTRLNTVGKEMGMTQQQALDLTKTVTQAIQVGGGSAQASEAAVQQFIQAMQGGTLRGEEFNSIMENGYGLAEALAKGLGVTTGELRKMAENGELSSERVIKAISSQAESVQATYNQFPLTIGQALQKITTSWEILIGKMDQSNGASATVAQWLSMLADNISELQVFIDDIGEGFVWIGDKLQNIDPSIINALKSTLSEAYDTVKSLISNVATLGETIWSAFTTALDSVSPLFAALLSGKDDVSGLEVALNVLKMAFAGISDVATGFNIGLKLLLSGIQFLQGGLYALSSQVLGFLGFDTLAQQAQNASDRMFAQAEKNGSEAVKLANDHKWAVVDAYNEIGKTQKERDADAVASSKAKLDQLLADQKAEVDGKKVSEDEKIAAVTAYAEAAIKANNGVLDGTVQAELTAKGYMVTLDQAGKVVVTSMLEAKKATEENAKAHELAIERSKKAEQDYQAFLKTSADEKIALNKQIEEAKKSGDLNALLSAQTSLAAIDAKEKELNQARKARAAEVDTGIQSSADKARKAAKDLGLDLDVSLNRVSEGFEINETNVVNLANGVEKLGAKGKQAGDVTYQAWLKWLETAKSQAEIDLAKSKLQEFEKQGVFSTKQVELGMEAIRRANMKLPDELDETGKAFERLGLKTKEQLKLAAESALADFNRIQSSGQATNSELQKGYERLVQAAHASGEAGVIAAADAKAASLGLKVQVDETGKATVESMSKAENAVHSLGRAAESSGQGFREMGQAARESAEEAKDSIQQWNDALEAKSQAQKEELSKSGTNKATGSSFGSYDRAGVIQELKDLGYSDDDARKYAGSIMSAALAKDKSMAQQTYGTGQANVFNKAYENLAKQGRTSSFGSQVVVQKLAELANGRGVGGVSIPSVSVPSLSNSSVSDFNQPSKTVNVNITSGNKTVKAMVPVGQENDLLELLSQAKSSA